MNKVSLVLIFFLAIVSIECTHKKASDEAVNSVLGNISFNQKFNRNPDKSDDEDLRLSTHLEYVEALLRNKSSEKLPENLKENRKKMLDLLHEYHTSGVFPRNYDFSDKRMPCFIDKDGRICAVGYLIEKTAGREVAEYINSKFKYDKIYDMDDPLIDEWIASSGLTKEECAMIQPNYSGQPNINRNYISTEYGISSAVLGGVNLSMGMLNAQQITFGKGNKTVPYIGLITGTGSIIYGALNYQMYETIEGQTTTNELKKALSTVNIGVGTATALLSVWNLVVNKPGKRYSFNLYSFPDQYSQSGVGLGFSYHRTF
ncbi:hypothetical protein RCC89_17085 [Cytophagaceae bacterium ABcell3]|nr:hypothetical protein RCC89_17085 [Cytophagaceae bacterium ABcell3]